MSSPCHSQGCSAPAVMASDVWFGTIIKTHRRCIASTHPVVVGDVVLQRRKHGHGVSRYHAKRGQRSKVRMALVHIPAGETAMKAWCMSSITASAVASYCAPSWWMLCTSGFLYSVGLLALQSALLQLAAAFAPTALQPLLQLAPQRGRTPFQRQLQLSCAGTQGDAVLGMPA